MPSDPTSPEQVSQSSNATPKWHFAIYFVIGAVLHLVLFLTKVPGRWKSPLFGAGMAFMAGAVVAFLFPEVSTWTGRKKIPFRSRPRAIVFSLIVITAMLATVLFSFNRLARWW